ncbi:MAG: acyltransferase family protein [Eubacteriales bacterium]|nr:acyltransferase family protein [Eubacteriales bacterium]
MEDNLRLSAGPERDPALDILKCICCVGVIIIHTASLGFSTYIVRCFNWMSSAAWSCMFRFCVPVFLMCTGAVLLDPQKEMSIRRIMTRYFLRMLLILMFWSLMYDLYFVAAKLVLYREYEAGAFLQAFVNTLTFRHYFHLYYLQMLLIFYLFLPALRVFTAHADRNVFRYILIIWFILGIVFPYVWKFEPMASNDGVPAQYPLSNTYAAIGYAMLGWYVRSSRPGREQAGRYIGLLILGYALVFGGTVAVSLYLDTPYGDLMEGMTPGVALMALGLFGTVSSLTAGKGPMPRAERFARASFCIYLIHHFFVLAFRGLNINVYLFYCLFSIPVLSAAVLLLSVLGYLVLSRTPFVKDHLIQ